MVRDDVIRHQEASGGAREEKQLSPSVTEIAVTPRSPGHILRGSRGSQHASGRTPLASATGWFRPPSMQQTHAFSSPLLSQQT